MALASWPWLASKQPPAPCSVPVRLSLAIDRPTLLPPQLLPPCAYPELPASSVGTKFVTTSFFRVRGASLGGVGKWGIGGVTCHSASHRDRKGRGARHWRVSRVRTARAPVCFRIYRYCNAHSPSHPFLGGALMCQPCWQDLRPHSYSAATAAALLILERRRCRLFCHAQRWPVSLRPGSEFNQRMGLRPGLQPAAAPRRHQPPAVHARRAAAAVRRQQRQRQSVEWHQL